MNFDNVIDSYYSLLEVSTFKGWIGIISDAVDSRVSSIILIITLLLVEHKFQQSNLSYITK